MNEKNRYIMIDYIPSKECVNESVYCTCYKCGECGRVFDEDGIMIDDGGTTVSEEEC